MAKNRGQILFTGRLANMVGQKMRGEYTLRKWMSPSNPQTTLQTLFRDRLADQVTAWRSIPESWRQLWRDYALALSTPDTTYDGYTLFLSSNLRLLSSGQDVIMTPPIGKVFTPFAITSSALSVAQDAPGSASIDLTTSFNVNDPVGVNRGGYSIEMLLPIGSRQNKYCPTQRIGSYNIEAGDTSPKTFTIDTGLDTDLFPLTLRFRLQASTQVGRPAGYTDWTELTFAVAP